MKQPFKFIFGGNYWSEHIALVMGLIAFIINSYILLQAAFSLIAISMFIKLLINVWKYFDIVAFEKHFGKDYEE